MEEFVKTAWVFSQAKRTCLSSPWKQLAICAIASMITTDDRRTWKSGGVLSASVGTATAARETVKLVERLVWPRKLATCSSNTKVPPPLSASAESVT
eukprot:5444249-Pleurochrysis_carterae.AAC.1